jgi:hypothetical protein
VSNSWPLVTIIPTLVLFVSSSTTFVSIATTSCIWFWLSFTTLIWKFY